MPSGTSHRARKRGHHFQGVAQRTVLFTARRGRRVVSRRTVTGTVTGGEKDRRLPALQHQSGERGQANGERKRDVQKEKRHERGNREQVQQSMFQRSAPDAQHGVQDDSHHHRLHAVEEAANDRHVGVGDRQPAQEQQHEDRRDDEERAGHDPTGDAVHAPGDVDRQLGCLRPRQQHREIQCPQEHRLADPALLVDELAVHDRDLAGRSAEIDEAELEPEAERLAKRHLGDWAFGGSARA
jgi:hypothetical protein